jgi:putative autotransporter adhesin-like protein
VVIGVTAAVVYAIVRDGSSTDVVTGSGVPTTETRALPAFENVELAGSNNVMIHVGAPQTVSVYRDDNLVAGVRTKVDSSTLVIANKPGSFTTRTPMRVEVSVPSLSALTLAGSGTINVTGVNQPDFAVLLSGSGVIRVRGRTDVLTVTITGSGSADLGPLIASDVGAVVTGSGQIVVTATHSLDASVLGTGSILYGGNPSDVTRRSPARAR